MKEVLKNTYELYQSKLQDLFNEVTETKKMLNRLAKDLGESSVPYPDVSAESIGGATKLRADSFYNKPLATAVREYLDMRKQAVEWSEIVKALREGGYELPKTRQAEDDARLTILRNTSNFVLIGDNYFGLKSWYPESKPKIKIKLKSQNQENTSEQPQA